MLLLICVSCEQLIVQRITESTEADIIDKSWINQIHWSHWLVYYLFFSLLMWNNAHVCRMEFGEKKEFQTITVHLEDAHLIWLKVWKPLKSWLSSIHNRLDLHLEKFTSVHVANVSSDGKYLSTTSPVTKSRQQAVQCGRVLYHRSGSVNVGPSG